MSGMTTFMVMVRNREARHRVACSDSCVLILYIFNITHNDCAVIYESQVRVISSSSEVSGK